MANREFTDMERVSVDKGEIKGELSETETPLLDNGDTKGELLDTAEVTAEDSETSGGMSLDGTAAFKILSFDKELLNVRCFLTCTGWFARDSVVSLLFCESRSFFS